MTQTAISMINDVLQATGGINTKTAFSNNDDTNLILSFLNDGLERIQSLKPTYVDAEGTIAVTPSTRAFDGVSGLDLYDIYPDTFRFVDSAGVVHPIELVHFDFIFDNFPNFETDEATVPQYAYIDRNQIGIYPLLAAGSSNGSLKFHYPTTATQFTATTDTVNLPQKWLAALKKYAQLRLEARKGLGSAQITSADLDALWCQLVAKTCKGKRTGFRSYRRFN